MLIMNFRAQNATSRPHHLTVVAFANIRKEKEESLHDFMERFSSVSIRIRNLNLEVTLTSMIMALKSGLI
ncbi:hypothetical protein GmHk_05G013366 [Glycine max]|nr:hypothetical protein GmHk_05G013366 [Glycine max]